MLALAEGLSAEKVRTGYVQVYREMLAAGYTAVGEFHYLGLAEAHAAVEAAAEAGIEIVLLLSAYARGGLERSRQDSVADYLSQLEELRAAGVRVGLAPHSVRACPRDWLEELGAYAARESLPLHVPRRRAAARDRGVPRRARCAADRAAGRDGLSSGRRPRSSTPPTADAHELDLVAEAGARVCVCPTTEANLGDGFAPVEESASAGSASASARTRTSASTRSRSCASSRGSRAAAPAAGRRLVSSLLCFGADEGAAALGLERWPDVEVDLEHPSLAGVEAGDVHCALVFGCGADVFRADGPRGPDAGDEVRPRAGRRRLVRRQRA
jgi:formimidoylglutamate deiminase